MQMKSQIILHTDTISTDSVLKAFDQLPSFSLYKDNFFIFGPAIGPKITQQNTNVKFQISVGVKVTKTTLPFNTYLYFFYNQKVIWNVLENSLPMHELNFNPGVGIAKPIFSKGRYLGKVTLQLEHESNGRDSINSRSWNRVTFGGDLMLTNNWIIHAKFWIPVIDGEHNRDILRYAGIGQIGSEYRSNNNRWRISVTAVKRGTWHPDFNTIVDASWQFSRKTDWCLFMQYYNGYAENLLDYKDFNSQFRIGVAIRPKYFNYY